VRVGISLLTLVPGVSGGSETYARQLVRALARAGGNEYRVFLPATATELGGLPSEVVHEYRIGRTRSGRLAAMALASLPRAPIRRRFAGLDAVHFPLTVPVPPTGGPVVVTLHDTQHLDLPQHFPRAERIYRRVAYDRAAKRADAAIVLSAFVRARAVERLGLDPARVHVVPLGVDSELFHSGDEPREPFLLYPARPWPHKNHRRLFQAFALARLERPELRLVLTGGGTEALTPLPPGVDGLGAVSPEELAGLYRRAACLVFPSLYEGFGLPPLEAMASGCPVAAARAAAIPEVCGEEAVLFDPYDPEAIASGVEEALVRADELHAKGVARAAQFSWQKTAEAHAAVYRTLAQ
jgi:glycosyltransferase involved in cell wall biosynthesis